MSASAEVVKQRALELGFDSVGVCEVSTPPHIAEYRRWLDQGYHASMAYLENQFDLKCDPRLLLPGAQSIVAVSLNYYQSLPQATTEPKIARYAVGRDYHKVLRSKLRRLAASVVAEHPEAKSRACVDSAPVFERDFARLAGLGWFGKNTMLIDSRRGSWFFIGLLLTTVPFEPDPPAVGGCGSCGACVDACPTGAIVHEGGRWQIDARRCISYLTIEHRGSFTAEQRNAVGDWTFGCDVCQEVCPFNAARSRQPLRAQQTKSTDFEPRIWPSLTELAQVDRSDWDRLTQGSAVRRAGFEGLRRNALVNLENAAG